MEKNVEIQHYLDVIKRRKSQFLVPGVLVFVLIAIITFMLPPVYKTTATIQIEAQEIPEDLVQSTVSGYVEERLQVLTRTVLNHANLSKIIRPDVDASNGIIHAIDTVLLPPTDAEAPTQTITEIAAGDPNFSTLVTALVQRGLDGTLNDPSGDFTVFAPTNAAFDALLADLGITAEELLKNPALSDILLKHVVEGSVDSITAFTLNGAEVPTLNPDGETVKLEIDSGAFTVDGAQVTTFDIQATNGVIHVIDAVITLDP